MPINHDMHANSLNVLNAVNLYKYAAAVLIPHSILIISTDANCHM